MSIIDKVDPYVSSEDGELFDLSFNTDEISFTIIELTIHEINEFCSLIKDQAAWLVEAYQSSTSSMIKEEK